MSPILSDIMQAQNVREQSAFRWQFIFLRVPKNRSQICENLGIGKNPLMLRSNQYGFANKTYHRAVD